jgi:hypothetical protein
MWVIFQNKVQIKVMEVKNHKKVKIQKIAFLTSWATKGIQLIIYPNKAGSNLNDNFNWYWLIYMFLSLV